MACKMSHSEFIFCPLRVKQPYLASIFRFYTCRSGAQTKEEQTEQLLPGQGFEVVSICRDEFRRFRGQVHALHSQAGNRDRHWTTNRNQ